MQRAWKLTYVVRILILFILQIRQSIHVILNTFQKTRDQNNFVQMYNTGVERRGFLYDGY